MTRGQRRRYPPDWESLARECKALAGWQCSQCGVRQYSLMQSRKGKPYIVYLHAAHKHHDTHNPEPSLICLCLVCHARYDYEYKQRAKCIALERLKHRLALARQGDLRWY